MIGFVKIFVVCEFAFGRNSLLIIYFSKKAKLSKRKYSLFFRKKDIFYLKIISFVKGLPISNPKQIKFSFFCEVKIESI